LIAGAFVDGGGESADSFAGSWNAMPWLSVVQARKSESVGDGVEIRGWVRTRRDSKGGFSFLEINDGSCMGNLQVIVPAELGNYQSEVLTSGRGAAWWWRGS